ncbi:MAG: thioredoxin family protein [Methanobacteriota archaeon]|nr:MAG: thioredoxin family protein [Euryarchaeota archaeon]
MNTKQIIDELFPKGITYEDYLKRSNSKLGKMKAGYEATEQLLTDHEDVIDFINRPMNVLLFAENWCGDCANGVPVIAKLAEVCDQWNFRILPKDDHEEIFSKYFTTAGKKKIPLLIFMDQENHEIARWFERPTEAYKLITKYKKLPQEEFIQKLREAPEFQVPGITNLVLKEVLAVAEKSAALLESFK